MSQPIQVPVREAHESTPVLRCCLAKTPQINISPPYAATVPVIANRMSIPLGDIFQIKNINLNSLEKCNIKVNWRSSNGVLTSWSFQPTLNESCLETFMCCFDSYTSVMAQLVKIKCQWKIMLELEVRYTQGNDLKIQSNKFHADSQKESDVYLMESFNFFEKSLVHKANTKYTIHSLYLYVCTH